MIDARATAFPADVSPAAGAGSGFWARARIGLCYGWRHRRLAALNAPTRFTEWVQHRKLTDRDPRLPALSDKLLVKAHVAAALGPEWVTPTLWHGRTLPAAPLWPAPFVVKARHGCRQNAFVHGADADWSAILRQAERWQRQPYGGWLDEWAYRDIPRGLLVEPFLGRADRLPIDYKLYVFGGQAAAVQVHVDRASAHRWFLLDLDWRPVGLTMPAPAPRPASLPAMIAAAETLGQGFDFVRVDFYEVAGAPRFGEMTFYPGSGLDAFAGAGVDAWLGGLWSAACAGRSGFNAPRPSSAPCPPRRQAAR